MHIIEKLYTHFSFTKIFSTPKQIGGFTVILIYNESKCIEWYILKYKFCLVSSSGDDVLKIQVFTTRVFPTRTTSTLFRLFQSILRNNLSRSTFDGPVLSQRARTFRNKRQEFEFWFEHSFFLSVYSLCLLTSIAFMIGQH